MPTIFRFLLGGGLVFAALTAATLGLHAAGLSRFSAYAAAQGGAFVLAFLVHRNWTFRATAGDARRQALHFLAANLGFRVVDWCLYAAISLLLAPPIVATILLTGMFVFPARYFYLKRRVFRAAGGGGF